MPSMTFQSKNPAHINGISRKDVSSTVSWDSVLSDDKDFETVRRDIKKL